jgi:Tape measure protein
MSSVDSRIVTMKFDNKQFQQGAAETMSTLDKLKSSLSFSGATKGLDNLAASTSSVEGGITKINSAFVALGTVAVTAISNITTKLMSLAGQQAQSLSGIQAMQEGFSDYELKVGATQTIMAGTGAGIGEVTKSLKELDIYADETIYRLSDMTSNIGKFTNAGVKLPVAVDAMKGIANVAALSGASAEEASRAMYNLGQSIGQGTVKLMDWKSVELANMGTKEFKEQLIDSAVAAGTLTKGLDGTIKTVKGTEVNFKTFSSTLSEGWLTSKALTDTLGNYADKTTDIGKKAYKAATEVKTFSMMMETLKAAAGTGWTDTFETVIGTLPEATELFTGMTNAIGGVIGASADARNNLLRDWKELGGRTDLIEGFKNIFGAIGDVLGPIREAFREIFPPTTGKQLADLTKNFREFAENLRLSEGTMANLKASFKGIFAVFSIVKQAITGVVGVIFDLVGAIGGALGGVGGGGILGFTAKIGDFVSGLDKAIKKGSLFTNFFEKVSAFLVPAAAAIAGFAQALFALATGQSSTFLDDMSARFESLGPIIANLRAIITDFSNTVTTKFNEIRAALGFGDKLDSGVGEMKATLGEVPGILDRVKEAWNNIKKAFSGSGDFLAPMIDSLKNAFSILQSKIADFVKDMGIEEALALINTGFFIALYMALRSFVGKMGGLVDQMGGMFESAGGVLKQVTSNLKTMQADIKANVILKIAAALALLTASILVLSRIDTVNLGKSLLAVALLLKMMSKALSELDSDDSSIKSTTKMTILSVALVGLGLAVLTFSAAVAVLGNMDTGTLVKGITAIGAILGIVITATTFLNKSGGAAGLTSAAAALLILSVALVMFAGAIKLYSMIDTGTMLEGGLKIVAALAAIAFVMQKMPPNMLASAAAIIIVSQALVILSVALKALGSLSVEEMAKSITMLGLSLLIIALGLNAMTGAIGGAAALMLFAVALTMLVPPLVMLGNLKLETLGKALLALVGIFVVFAAAGILMGPLVPVLLGLAGAMALVGLAAIAIGAGLFLFATGLGVLAASGAAGAAVLVGVVISIAQLFPLIMQQIGLGIIAFAKVIGDGAPILVEALTKLIKSLLKQAETLIPLLPPIISKAITAFLQVIKDNQPKFIQAGYDWILAILEGLANNIGKLAKKAGDLVIAFLNAWATEYPRMVSAGAKAIIKFVDGMANAVDDNASEMGAAGSRLGIAIIKGMAKGILGGIGEVASAAKQAAGAALNAAKSFLGIKSPSKAFAEVGRYANEGFAVGLQKYSSEVATASEDLGKLAVDSLKSTMNKLTEDLTLELNSNPVITPVLDLSKFQSGTEQMSAAFGGQSVNANVSFGQASGISQSAQDQQNMAYAGATGAQEASIIFEQNNYSPTALSPVEIYRQTKNQLSLAKGVLT